MGEKFQFESPRYSKGRSALKSTSGGTGKASRCCDTGEWEGAHSYSAQLPWLARGEGEGRGWGVSGAVKGKHEVVSVLRG